MDTNRRIVDEIGRKALADALGVRITAVGNVVSDGVFPAAWYPTVFLLAAEKGLFVPFAMFSFRLADDARRMDELNAVAQDLAGN